MKKLKYLLLFVFVLLLSPNVFAAEFNMNNYTSATLNGTKNRYRATEIYNYGSSGTYTFGTQYSGRISDIETYFDYPFSANLTYTLTYNMNTDDFRNNFGSSYWWYCDQEMTNNNAHVVLANYISYRKVKLSFTTDEASTCIRVWLRSTNVNSTAITGVSNWRLNSITIYDPEWQDGTTSGSGSQGTTSGSQGTTPNNSNQDIIDNANQNTQDIINNNNANTQAIIDSSLSCGTGSNLFNIASVTWGQYNVYNNESGSYTNAFIGYVNDIEPQERYSILVNSTVPTRFSYQFLDSSGTVLSGSYYSSAQRDLKIQDIIAPSMATRLLISQLDSSQDDIINIQVQKGRTVNRYEPYCRKTSEITNDKIDETTDAINRTNDYLMDDSNPNISDNEFTSLFNSVGFNDPLANLLQLPVQFINQLVSQSNSCQTVSLGTLWGVSLTLPCIDIGSIIGQQVWDVIDVLFSVGLLVVIFKNLYQTFANLMTLGGEKEAREKFSMPTPMEFLSVILGGDR